MSKFFMERFMIIWHKAMAEGYSCNDARDLANLELTGKLFHE